MQLNTLKGAALLGAAVARLLGPQAAQAVDLRGLEVEQATLIYQEQGRIGVVEPVLQLRLPLSGEKKLGLRYGFDAMSGASPNGASPTVTHQTFTSPSGNHYTTASGDLPVRSFRDQRHALALDWEQPLSRTLALSAGLNASFETDYRSLGASLTLRQDLNQRLSTLSVGASISEDELKPKGGLQEGLGSYQDSPTGVSSGAKHIQDALVGWTQIMNRRWLSQVNVGLGWDAGFMSDPYKGVTLVDSQGQPVMVASRSRMVNERRPATRARRTLYWGNAVHLGRDVLHADYRLYQDDGGVKAHTVDLQYWWKPQSGMPGLRLRPQLRFSRQSKADCYAHSMLATTFDATQPAYLSSDSRLAANSSWTFSLRLDLPEADWGHVWIKPAYMRQSFNLDPAPVGVQGDIDLVPDLNVWMLTLGIGTRL
jgi:hypothetical protein